MEPKDIVPKLRTAMEVLIEQRDVAQECHKHALDLAKRQMARAESAEAEVALLKNSVAEWRTCFTNAAADYAESKAEVERLRKGLEISAKWFDTQFFFEPANEIKKILTSEGSEGQS